MARSFALLGLLLVALTAHTVSGAATPKLTVDVLNFALNLECLEGQFYSCAVYGKPLSSELTGGGPAPIGCEMANLTDYMGIAKSIANDEMNHVKFLRTVLGKDAVKCPQVDIGPAFAVAADAAANTTLKPPFSPYANDLFFLHGAFIFEDVGVTAYNGAVPVLPRSRSKNGALNSAVLSAASGIASVEAYHAGAVRTLLLDSADVETPYGIKVKDFITAISNLRDALDQAGTNKDEGIIAADGATILAPVDKNSVVFSRSPTQVLRIVYGNAKAKPGLFFPKGLNGAIH